MTRGPRRGARQLDAFAGRDVRGMAWQLDLFGAPAVDAARPHDGGSTWDGMTEGSDASKHGGGGSGPTASACQTR